MRLVEWFYPKKLSKTKKIIFDLCRGCGPTSLTAEAEDFMAFKNTSQFCLRWWILSFSMSFPHIFESAFTSLCQFWPKFLTFRSNIYKVFFTFDMRIKKYRFWDFEIWYLSSNYWCCPSQKWPSFDLFRNKNVYEIDKKR